MVVVTQKKKKKKIFRRIVCVLCCRYGFVVYGDGTVTDVACKGLNGMRMGDRTLTVRRATEVTSSFHAVPCNQNMHLQTSIQQQCVQHDSKAKG